MLLPTDQQEKILNYIKSNISIQEKKLNKTKIDSRIAFQNWIKGKKYKALAKESIPIQGLQAHYNFSNASLKSSYPGVAGNILTSSSIDKPVFADRENGKALVLNGDQWYELKKVGVFRKSDPFSINISVFIPKDFKEGVLFHKSVFQNACIISGVITYI